MNLISCWNHCVNNLGVSLSEVISESGITVDSEDLISKEEGSSTRRDEFIVGRSTNSIVHIGVDIIVQLSYVSIEDVVLLNHD